MYNETITQRLALGNGIAPQTLNNATLNSDGVDMQKSKRVFFILSIGAVTGGGSISAWLQESADNSSWTANGQAGAFSNSGGNNVSQTGLTTANNEITFEVRADQLTTGKRYVRLQIKETGSQNVLVSAAAFGDEVANKPGNANNGANVATQNVVSEGSVALTRFLAGNRVLGFTRKTRFRSQKPVRLLEDHYEPANYRPPTKCFDAGDSC
jgi:hypothetical protein